MIKKTITAGIITLMIVVLTGITVLAQEPSVLIQRAKAVERTISETLTVYGRVQPAPDAEITISLPHAGLITRVEVRLGQRIRNGEPLMALATSPEAYVQYIQARNAEQYAERELVRQQRMLMEKVITKAQMALTRKALTDARSRVKALENQGQNKTTRTLISPMNGIVVHIGVKQGERVQADTAVLTIASEDHLIAELGIEPEDIHLIKPGTPVTIQSIFVPDYQVHSQLLEIHAMINPNTHLVDALALIPKGKTDHLVLGSYIKAVIQLKIHTGITVPRSAVLQDDQGHYIFIVIKGRAKRINVKTGQKNHKWIEITSGIKPSQQVVSVGNYVLKDGMAVREKR